MNFRASPLVAAVLIVGASQPHFGQSSDSENLSTEVIGQGVLLHWQGIAGRTYFVRTSSDLRDWGFIPEIEHGEDHFQYGFETSQSRLLFEVLYTDKSAIVDGELNPEEADFDDDGLPSLYELMNDLNPLDSQTVEGVPDGQTDREQDGRIDNPETGAIPPSHPSRVDNPKVQLAAEVLPAYALP